MEVSLVGLAAEIEKIRDEMRRADALEKELAAERDERNDHLLAWQARVQRLRANHKAAVRHCNEADAKRLKAEEELAVEQLKRKSAEERGDRQGKRLAEARELVRLLVRVRDDIAVAVGFQLIDSGEWTNDCVIERVKKLVDDLAAAREKVGVLDRAWKTCRKERAKEAADADRLRHDLADERKRADKAEAALALKGKQ